MNRIKAFWNANNFPLKTFRLYWKDSSTSELIMDIFVPILIASIMLFNSSLSEVSFKGLFESFRELSGQVIAAISILAGFNIASITILATITNGPTSLLKRKKTSDGANNLYDSSVFLHGQ